MKTTRLAVTLSVLACMGAAAPAAQAAPLTCPSTFAVLHHDHIGKLDLPAGPYTITVLDSSRLTCHHASDLFRQFLEDWDGRLPRPWVADVATRTFTRGAGSTLGFTVAPAGNHTGGGGGRHPAVGEACPNTFQVAFTDHIGALRVAKGRYRITVLAVGRLTCRRAAQLFSAFLDDFDGNLPGGWTLDPFTGTFTKGTTHIAFRVKPAAGSAAGGGGSHPNGSRCRATFRVQHNDRIGRLRLPRGNYWITPLARGNVTCARASNLFRQFLNRPAGNLQRPWVIEATTGTFRRGHTRNGFRVKRTRPITR